jgi:hypothetical protein
MCQQLGADALGRYNGLCFRRTRERDAILRAILAYSRRIYCLNSYKNNGKK